MKNRDLMEKSKNPPLALRSSTSLDVIKYPLQQPLQHIYFAAKEHGKNAHTREVLAALFGIIHFNLAGCYN